MKTVASSLLAAAGCLAVSVTTGITAPLPWDYFNQSRMELPQGNYEGVAFGNGKFLLAASNSPVKIAFSSDGQSWSQTSFKDVSVGAINSVSFANGRFYVGVNSGAIVYSSDAVNWVWGSWPANAAIHDLAYGGGTYVAVSDPDFAGSNLSVSSNPTNGAWTQRSVAGPQALNGVAFGNGTFVVVGAEGRIATSPNAITWTVRSSGTASILRSVAYGAGVFVAVGVSGTIRTSSDGVTWTGRTSGTMQELNKVTYANGIFVAVGAGGTILTSADGVTWSSHLGGTARTLRAVSFGNGTFAAVGEDSTVSVSSDATNWVGTVLPAHPLTSQRLTSVTYAPDQFVAVGFGGTVITSPDGVLWTNRNSGTSLGLYSVAYGNGLYVAVGRIILSSPDAITWTVRDSGPNYDFETVAYVNGHFMAVGAGGVIKLSTNGVNWFNRSSPTSAILYGVAYGRGLYVITGSSGSLWTSPNLANWTSRPPGLFLDINGVTYANGQFVAQGNGGLLASSSDGINWTSQLHWTGVGLTTSAYGFDNWVAVGLDGTILSSTDGLVWAVLNKSTPNLLIGVAAGPSTFVAVGDNGTIIQSLGLEPIINQATSNLTVVAGGPLQLSANVIGAPPLTFRWFNDGNPLAVTTNGTLTLSNIPSTGGGWSAYSVIVSNKYGSTVNSAVAFIQTIPFSITTRGINSWPTDGPTFLDVFSGTDVTFGVGVQSFAPVTYQWWDDGPVPIALTGQTGPVLVVTNIQTATPSREQTYRVVVSNRYGSDSVWFTVNIVRRIQITQQPQSQAVFTGSNATFSVTIINPDPPVSFQWRFNGVDIPGATNATLGIPNVQPIHAGQYQVVIKDAKNTNISAAASLSLIDAPSPSVETLAATDVATNRATFHGVVNPNGGFTVAHFEYGLDASYGSSTAAVDLGTGSNPLALSNTVAGLFPNTTYHFRLAATNSGGANYGVDQTFSTPFSPAQLVFITTQPQNQSVFPGNSASFSVSANSGFPLRYQWQFNASDIPGATNSTLTVTNAQDANGGDYTVIVANMFTSVTSVMAKLQLRIGPTITQQPQPVTVVQGQNATFTVTVTNTAILPITYQWRKGATAITNILLNARECSFTLYNVKTNVTATSGPGSYQVAISNATTVGSSVPSSSAELIVTPAIAPLIVQQPLPATHAVGEDVTFTVVVTNTATLPILYQWRKGSVLLTNFLLNSTTSSFTLFNVQTNVTVTNGPGGYRVTITNAGTVGLGLSSIVVPLEVIPLTPPIALTQESTNISAQGATLAGSVNPNGAATTAYFEYGLTASYGNSTPAISLGKGIGTITVSQAVTGLLPNTNYHFRVVASSRGGITTGSDLTFITAGSSVVPMLVAPMWQGNQFTVSVATVPGASYYLEHKTSLDDPDWTQVSSVTGNGLVLTLTDSTALSAQGFYRVRAE